MNGSDDSVAGARLLVATGATAGDVGQLPPLVRHLLELASEVLVITPILPGRLEWLVSDTDRARYEADERLGAVLGQLEQLDVPATGQVGDETPVTAFDDAVSSFRPDHILIALRSGDSAGWQERGLIDELRDRYGIPITIFELDRTPSHAIRRLTAYSTLAGSSRNRSLVAHGSRIARRCPGLRYLPARLRPRGGRSRPRGA